MKRFLLMFKDWIFESSVDRAIPQPGWPRLLTARTLVPGFLAELFPIMFLSLPARRMPENFLFTA